jgi:hypothetical protein
MKEKIIAFAQTNRKYLVGLALLLALLVFGYFLWQYFHPPQPITGESQQQAETPSGVELAAHNAQVGMLQSQLEEAAQQIAVLKNQPPNTVIQTVPVHVPYVVEQQRQQSGADFAIVTDPAHPSTTVDLQQVEQLPANTTVTLNQYNVQAFKKVIRGITIYPDWGKTVQGNPGVNEITADGSRRITKDGKYLGVAAGYDFKNEEVKLGIRYTF